MAELRISADVRIVVTEEHPYSIHTLKPIHFNQSWAINSFLDAQTKAQLIRAFLDHQMTSIDVAQTLEAQEDREVSVVEERGSLF